MEQQSPEKKLLLNPTVIAVWGFFLSPILGSWLIAKNWEILGEPEKKKSSLYWLYGYIAYLVLFVSFDIIRFEIFANVLAIMVWFSWYLFSVKPQKEYISNNLQNNYSRKSFIKPILFTILIIVLLVTVISLLPKTDLSEQQYSTSDTNNDYISRSTFKDSIDGKTKEEVLNLIGKPSVTQNINDTEIWYYENITYDPITENIDSMIQLLFTNSTVSSISFM